MIAAIIIVGTPFLTSPCSGIPLCLQEKYQIVLVMDTY